mgnify:CR=1 FL=1
MTAAADEITVTLPGTTAHRLPDALSELAYGVRHAQAALDHIQEALSQSMSSDPGLISLIELASMGLERLIENEGEFVAKVEVILRRAVSGSITDDIARNDKGCKS